MTYFNNKWKNAVLTPFNSIKDAINNLNSTSLKIVLVVDPNNHFIGTVSDGDIRRALLKGMVLETPISEITNKNSVTVSDKVSQKNVYEIMQSKKLFQIPILTIKKKLSGLYVLEDLGKINKIDNIFFIMLGGKGTRLLPHTKNCPKPMLPVNGKPILAHIVEQAKSEGFHKFIFSINYLGHIIKDYFGNGTKFDISIEYVEEEKPLGTAGSLFLIKDPPDIPFIVTNGDVMASLKYSKMIDFHELNKAKATMAVKRHEWQNPFGEVITEGFNIKGFKEKPIYMSYINAGIYVLSPNILKLLDKNIECTMPELFEKARQKLKKTIVYPMHENWIDVGRPEDLF